MHLALVNDKSIEAKTGLKGFCRGCGQPVIAKCGAIRVHHWAHENTRMCDSWWEAETEWHRSWKNYFPHQWQECFMPDVNTGEKHIADVRTDDGLVIEFQYSHIDPQERSAREKFYKNMVWVVDGTRLKYDYPRFVKGHDYFQPTEQKGLFQIASPDECFSAAWLDSSVPVIFDYRGSGSLDDRLGLREPLYCLFPVRIAKSAVVAEIPRRAFIKHTTNGAWSVRTGKLIDKLLLARQEWQHQEEIIRLKLQIQDKDLARRRLSNIHSYGKRRRF